MPCVRLETPATCQKSSTVVNAQGGSSGMIWRRLNRLGRVKSLFVEGQVVQISRLFPCNAIDVNVRTVLPELPRWPPLNPLLLMHAMQYYRHRLLPTSPETTFRRPENGLLLDFRLLAEGHLVLLLLWLRLGPSAGGFSSTGPQT